jgi:heat shock protein HtpX
VPTPDRPVAVTRTWVVATAAAPSLVLGLVLTVVLVVLFGFFALLPGVAITAALVMWMVSRLALDPAPQLLAALEARDASPERDARLVNIVEGLSLSGGISGPALHVVEDDAANMVVLGIDDHDTHVIVTAGLLARLERVELEAVLARAVSQIRRGDLAAVTTAIEVFTGARGGPALLARPVVGLVRARLEQSRDDDDDILLDRDAVALTRYPPGLVAALGKIASSSSVVDRPIGGTARLWLVDPRPDGGGDRPSLEDRIAALEML